MASFDEEMVAFEAVEPQQASTADIERGHRLLGLIAPEDAGRRVAVLVRLGSFYLESRELNPIQSVESAQSCFAEVVRIARANQNVKWLQLGYSLGANTLCCRYRRTRDPDDLAKSEQLFCDLIALCETTGTPEEAASAQMDYAVLLVEAAHGDQFSNLEKAIGLLREVVKRFSPPVRGAAFDPDPYTRALHNLGEALLKQTEEPHVRSMNIDEAVSVLQDALVYPPAERGVTQRIHVLRALAAAYPDWSGADSLAHARHLADAANAEADALEQGGGVPHKAPWAVIAQHRSALFRDLDDIAIGPEGRTRMIAAIKEHKAHVDQIPLETLPFLWAEWVGGFARLVGRIGVEDTSLEHFYYAVDCFQAALEVVPGDRDPKLCLILNRELGKICHESQEWELSLEANRRAATIGLWLGGIAGTALSRENELASVTRAVHFAVFAAAQLGRPREAAELAEMGRARWLDTALRVAAIRRSHASDDVKAAVDHAQAAVLELERQEMELQRQGAGGAMRGLQDFLGIPFGGQVKIRVISDPKGEESRRRSALIRVRSELQQAHAQLYYLLDAESSSRNEVLPKWLSCDQIQNIATKAGLAIVYMVTSTWGSTAIVVGPTVEVLPLPDIDRPTVQKLLYGKTGFTRLTAGKAAFEASLRAIEDAMSQHIIAPIAAWGRNHGIDTFAIVGLGDLGLLPLQIASVPADLNIRLLPSARALDLALMQRAGDSAHGKRLLTYSDPGSDGFRRLPFSRMESLMFQEAFKKKGATVYALPDSASLTDVEAELPVSTHLHLSCHGTFRPFSPFDSDIHLAGEQVLRLESLLRPALKLAGAELVVLSACNSASEEFWRTPDEAIGFPAALLAAGARTVVAAQWEVSDAATFLLMQRFCQELLNTNFEAARSLANAQRWLRSARSAELADIVHGVRDSLGDNEPRSKRLLGELRAQLLTSTSDPPLADRRFWAGFVCVGA